MKITITPTGNEINGLFMEGKPAGHEILWHGRFIPVPVAQALDAYVKEFEGLVRENFPQAEIGISAEKLDLSGHVEPFDLLLTDADPDNLYEQEQETYGQLRELAGVAYERACDATIKK